MTEDEEKAAFAALLLKTPTDPFKAALQLFPDNTSRALRVATEWPNDPAVIAARNKLIDADGELSFLPGKGDLGRTIWERMNNDRTDNEDFCKLAKLYAEIRGFIQKPENNTSVVVNNNKVMVVKDHGANEDWEAALQAQQRTLVSGGHFKH